MTVASIHVINEGPVYIARSINLTSFCRSLSEIATVASSPHAEMVPEPQRSVLEFDFLVSRMPRAKTIFAEQSKTWFVPVIRFQASYSKILCRI